ncbi:hypothetical protein Acsp02_95150 [Actinoplanes sp. NBRC 103695]|nr:hypothetical protein Acsp02_95150 [Actinoplanes sp. NBRC 103695]
MPSVLHQPRVVWDAALAFVAMAETPHHESFDAFAGQVHQRLGSETYEALRVTHGKLLDNVRRTWGDRRAVDIERGAWRVRMEELLRARPDLTDEVLELTSLVPLH